MEAMKGSSARIFQIANEGDAEHFFLLKELNRHIVVSIGYIEMEGGTDGTSPTLSMCDLQRRVPPPSTAGTKRRSSRGKAPRRCWHWVVCAELAGTAPPTAPAGAAPQPCWSVRGGCCAGLTAGPGPSGAQFLSWAPVAIPGVSALASSQVGITQGGNLHTSGLSFLLCQSQARCEA